MATVEGSYFSFIKLLHRKMDSHQIIVMSLKRVAGSFCFSHVNSFYLTHVIVIFKGRKIIM